MPGVERIAMPGERSEETLASRVDATAFRSPGLAGAPSTISRGN